MGFVGREDELGLCFLYILNFSVHEKKRKNISDIVAIVTKIITVFSPAPRQVSVGVPTSMARLLSLPVLRPLRLRAEAWPSTDSVVVSIGLAQGLALPVARALFLIATTRSVWKHRALDSLHILANHLYIPTSLSSSASFQAAIASRSLYPIHPRRARLVGNQSSTGDWGRWRCCTKC